MKRLIWCIALLLAGIPMLSAQKTALVDMNYILEHMPAYEKMNRELDALSKKWQAEIERINAEAEQMYKDYQREVSTLSATVRKARQDAIVAKEQEAYELNRKYFAPQGELQKRRESLMKPIEQKVWKRLKELAAQHGYQLIVDRATSKIVYADPEIDLSASVLEGLESNK